MSSACTCWGAQHDIPQHARQLKRWRPLAAWRLPRRCMHTRFAACILAYVAQRRPRTRQAHLVAASVLVGHVYDGAWQQLGEDALQLPHLIHGPTALGVGVYTQTQHAGTALSTTCSRRRDAILTCQHAVLPCSSCAAVPFQSPTCVLEFAQAGVLLLVLLLWEGLGRPVVARVHHSSLCAHGHRHTCCKP